MAQQGPQQRNAYYQWYQQNRALVWGTAAAAAALYGAYTYTSPGADDASSPQQRQRPQSQYQKLRSMLTNYSNAASTLAETASLVSTDLRSFLTSDSSEVPQSLRQLNKLLQSAELQETVTTVTSSVVKGVSRALPAGLGSAAGSDGPPLVDTIIEAVLSERGRGLVGMAVGVATRNATQAVCEFMERRMEAAASAAAANGGSVGIKEVLDVLTSEHGEKLLTLLLTKSIRTAVTSYVDATTGYNLYDDMLASMVKQEHRDALTDVLSRLTASFCKEVVISYRRATAAAAAQGAGAGASSAPAGKHHQQHQHHHAQQQQQHSAAAANAASGAVMPVMVKGGTLGSGCSLDSVLSTAASGGVELALTASTRCNGPLAGAVQQPQVGVNGRPAPAASATVVGSQQQQQQVLASRQHSVNGGINSALGRAMLAQASPVWLKQVVELVGQRDVRSLTVEVVRSASREATRGAVEGLLQGAQQSGARLEGGGSVLVLPACAAGYKLYVLATLAVSLAMYALSPRLVML
ncbi:hypothetical protein HXX76_001552 [Chlamydomonas incerta]|uniref:Uncharacterized protein n=1 Tax=Chlamydomonas incerta TaxID=51695 RepID=A0A835WCP0_CHLIN|nr:hypothetical protein HXX76_001552 [Chlamydomonas incerta]|eukprot:KAG2444810.1 hypothetical protein HXX76_001552 [Chlamydomonas incerta]